MTKPISTRRGNRFKDISGQRFNRLIALHPVGVRDHKIVWLCRCDCGNEHAATGSLLRKGHAKSCGCLPRDRMRDMRTTHGQTDTPTYSVWASMRKRCTNQNDACWIKYGAKGIRVCDRWLHSFENFYADMGQRPSLLHSI